MEDVFEVGGNDNVRQQGLHQVVEVAVVDALIDLASNPAASPAVVSRVEWMLSELHDMMARKKARNDMGRGHQARLAAEIARYLERAQEGKRGRSALDPPPGSPIGATQASEGMRARTGDTINPTWSFMDCSWGGR